MAWSRGSRSCAYMSIQASSVGGKLVRRQGRSPPLSSSRAGARPPRAVLAAGASRRSAQAQCSCRRILEGGQEDRLQNVFNGEGTEEAHGAYHPGPACVRRGAGPWGGRRGAWPLMSSGFYSRNGRWPDPKSSKQKGGAGYFPNYSIFCILLVCCC